MDNAGDITHATNIKVFSHGGITGSMPDAGTVTGQTSGATATIIHTTATQILLDSIAVSTFQSGEDVCDDSPTCSHKVTLSDVGDSNIAITLHVYDDDGAMDEAFTLDGLTTDANSYWKVTAPVGERHAGKDSDGTNGLGAKLDWSTTRIINNDDPFSEISWLIIDENGVANTTNSYIIDSSFEDHNFLNLIIMKNVRNLGLPNGIAADTGTIANVICDDSGGESEGCFDDSTGGAVAFINNTMKNCDKGIGGTGATGIVWNNLCENSATGDQCFQDNAICASGGNNACEDATCDDDAECATGALVSQDFTGVFVSSTDFHINAATFPVDAGDGTTASTYTTVDIDNQTRTGTWDIGSDEIISSARRRQGQLIGM